MWGPQVCDLCPCTTPLGNQQGPTLQVRKQGLMPRPVTSYTVTVRTRARAVGSRSTISNTMLWRLLKRTLIHMWPGFAEGEREQGASASGPRSHRDVSPSLSSCPELGFQDPPWG